MRRMWLVLLACAGCWGESPTGESWWALQRQCEATAGQWRTVADCPSACWPPEPTAENCTTLEQPMCMSVCSDQPSCDCPVEAPFWEPGTGCVGSEACPS